MLAMVRLKEGINSEQAIEQVKQATSNIAGIDILYLKMVGIMSIAYPNDLPFEELLKCILSCDTIEPDSIVKDDFVVEPIE